jgi:hypothetical protein
MIRIRPRGVATRSLKPLRALPPTTAAVFLAVWMVLFGASATVAAGPSTGFGFSAPDIAGFPTGGVALTGGGAFNSSTGFVHAGGSSQVNQGPLAGCLTGQGVRWDAAALLSGTTFQCTGLASEALKSAITDENTIVLQADFYRAGDGIDESFTAQMIVSADDIAPDILGDQNVWVQGVGCSTAGVHFSS